MAAQQTVFWQLRETKECVQAEAGPLQEALLHVYTYTVKIPTYLAYLGTLPVPAQRVGLP